MERFELDLCASTPANVTAGAMVPDDAGAWVRWTDALEAVEAERERCAKVCERLALDARNAAAKAEIDELFERLDGQRRVLLGAMHQIRHGSL